MKTNKYGPWDEFYSSLLQTPEWLKKPVPFIVKTLPLFKDFNVKKILDLGCGIGRHCIFLAKMGINVTGIDTSRRALKIAKAWSRTEKFETTLLLTTMTNLPFISQNFHAVISVSVIHHAIKRDIEKTVAEIYRVLNDDGIFLANILSIDDYRYGLGQEVEDGTFQVMEDFEEKRFQELHSFYAKEEVLDLCSKFKKIKLDPIQSGKKEQLHCYWKVTAIK